MSVTVQLGDTSPVNDFETATESGGFITVPLSGFAALDLTQIAQILVNFRTDGTLTGPFIAQ